MLASVDVTSTWNASRRSGGGSRPTNRRGPRQRRLAERCPPWLADRASERAVLLAGDLSVMGIVEVAWATQTDRVTISPRLDSLSFTGEKNGMHGARLLSEAKELAQKLGYRIREDLLDGAGGGHCVLQGQKWLLLDITQSAEEQLSDVLDALRLEMGLWKHHISAPLTQQLQLTSAA